MKKMLVMFAAVAALTIFAGCSSVQVADKADLSGQQLSTSGQAIAHINTTNFGLYFLWFPIVCGSAENTNFSVWFKDEVNVPSLVKLTTKTAANMKGTKTVDITSSRSSIGFLFSINRCEVSANVIR